MWIGPNIGRNVELLENFLVNLMVSERLDVDEVVVEFEGGKMR